MVMHVIVGQRINVCVDFVKALSDRSVYLSRAQEVGGGVKLLGHAPVQDLCLDDKWLLEVT